MGALLMHLGMHLGGEFGVAGGMLGGGAGYMLLGYPNHCLHHSLLDVNGYNCTTLLGNGTWNIEAAAGVGVIVGALLHGALHRLFIGPRAE